MATPISSQQELYALFLNTLQSFAPDLTDVNEGSISDSLAGAASLLAVELQKGVIDRFNKTFIETSHGPEVTQGADDLQTLATDHFGTGFARPSASSALGTVTFSRPNTNAGAIPIPAGSIVKTAPDASGVSQRYSTVLPVTLTGLSINASVSALVGGSAGNAQVGAVNQIESSLLDSSIVVTNGTAFVGGAEAQDDATYRETIRNKIEILRGAALAAIQAAALNVPGVATATPIETLQAVIPYNIATGLPVVGAIWFYIPNAVLYIADVNGNADSALIAAVQAAIAGIRAGGVRVVVTGAAPLSLNWTASITLNPAGANYAALSANTSLLTAAMANYINTLPIGTGFTKAAADAAILAIWGPSGSNDLASFQTAFPAAGIAVSATQKLIAGTMGTQ